MTDSSSIMEDQEIEAIDIEKIEAQSLSGDSGSF